MHYYQHHVGDYQRDTSSLSILEHGVYRLLMDEYYVTERPLPVGLDALCRTCRAITRAERLAVSIVVEKFFQVDGTVLRHRRIEAEIADYRSLQEIAARAGRASAKARQRKLNGRSTGVAVPLQRESNAPTNGTATNHEPVTSNQITAIPTPQPRAGIPISLEQAISMAETAGVPPDYAETIFNEHEGSTWEDGQGRPINSFSHYIKARYTNRTEKHAREEKRAAARTNGFANQPKPETVWSLKQQLEAVQGEIEEVNSHRVGVWGELGPKNKEKLATLQQKRKELRGKLSGLEERA